MSESDWDDEIDGDDEDSYGCVNVSALGRAFGMMAKDNQERRAFENAAIAWATAVESNGPTGEAQTELLARCLVLREKRRAEEAWWDARLEMLDASIRRTEEEALARDARIAALLPPT